VFPSNVSAESGWEVLIEIDTIFAVDDKDTAILKLLAKVELGWVL